MKGVGILILDNLARQTQLAEVAERIQAALAHSTTLDVSTLVTDQRVDWADGSFYFVQRYQAKPEAEGAFESHRKYIDIQLVMSGKEKILFAPLDTLEPSAPFDAEKDFGLYQRPAHSVTLLLGAGDYAVFYPWDGHMPSLRPGDAPQDVVKIIWKIPMES